MDGSDMNVSMNHSILNRYIKNLTSSEKIGFALVVAVAFLTRLYQLDSQMWLDEFSALLSIRRPWFEILTVWPGPSSHVLFEVLSNWSSTLFGESAFSLRLPAALFGVAGVITLVWIGSRIYTVRAGLFIAALMAVSYNHIFFSQNARGYTALIFFFLWSTYLFMRIVDSERIEPKTGFLYCLTIVAACYSQPFGVFIPASHFVIAIVLVALDAQNKGPMHFQLKKFIYWQVGAGVATLILYAPLIGGIKEIIETNIVSSDAAGSRFGMELLREIAEGLSAAFFGYVGLAIATLVGIIGVVIWLRKNAVSFFAMTLPIVLQAVVFLIMGFGIHPRYFAIAIPIIYVAGGISLFYLLGAVVDKIISNDKTRQLVHSLILSALVIVSAYPLIRYYTVPKQDFQGALQIVEPLAKADDIKVGIATVGMIMTDFYGSNYIRVDRIDELLKIESAGKKVWIVMTLERLMEIADPALVNHIREKYKLLQRLPGTIGGGSMQVYEQLEQEQ